MSQSKQMKCMGTRLESRISIQGKMSAPQLSASSPSVRKLWNDMSHIPSGNMLNSVLCMDAVWSHAVKRWRSSTNAMHNMADPSKPIRSNLHDPRATFLMWPQAHWKFTSCGTFPRCQHICRVGNCTVSTVHLIHKLCTLPRTVVSTTPSVVHC